MLRTLSAVAALTIAAMGPAAAEPAIIQFHADWCGSCKELAPKLDAAVEELEKSGTQFTVLDFTQRSKKSRAAQREIAVAAGAGDVFDAYAPKTGYAVVYDTETGEDLGKISKHMTTEEIIALVEGAGV